MTLLRRWLLTIGVIVFLTISFGAQVKIIPSGSGSSGAAVWGSITGTLSSQTDLNTALGTKTTLAEVDAQKLSVFAATTSAELAGVLSDEAGTGGGFVRATSPTITTGTFTGVAVPITSKTSDYTVTSSDYTLLCNATGGSVTFTLTAASARSGQVLVFKKTDSSGNTCVINRAGSDTIDGATSLTLSTQYQSATIQADGTSAWWIQ